MGDITIALAAERDIALLDTALRQLSADLGDRHMACKDSLAAAVCGPDAHSIAILAHRSGAVAGALLAAPVFSTIWGGAGLFVTDLWVAAPERGKGLSRRLIATALHEGARRRAAQFVKLAVYENNPEARAAYTRLGFTAQTDETNMILTGKALNTLKESQ